MPAAQPVVGPVSPLLGVDDPGVPEHAEVVRDQGLRRVEILGEMAHTELLAGECLHD